MSNELIPDRDVLVKLLGAGQGWETLAQDPDTSFSVLDSEGNVQYANRHAATMVADGDPQSIMGRNLADFLPAEAAKEQIRFVNRVFESGQSLTINSIWRGRRTRTRLTRINGVLPDSMYVIAIARYVPGINGDLNADPVGESVNAKNIDLGPLSNLTPRELEVLSLIGEGLSAAAIAKKLFRSVKTIEWYRASLGNKLSVTNRVELARYAISAGLAPGLTEGDQDNDRPGDKGPTWGRGPKALTSTVNRVGPAKSD